MLNVFPELLTFSLAGPFILRLVLGYVFFNLGKLNFGEEKRRWVAVFEMLRIKPAEFFARALGVIEIVGGIMLILGIFTQIAALIFAVISLAELWIEYREPTILKRNLVFYVLIFAISLSLLFTGAGFFAFDLPL